jgi:hypothetical protein
MRQRLKDREGELEMIALLVGAMLTRLRAAPRAQSGQVIYMAAIMVVCLSGGIALAVDIGRAYQQRQVLESMAQSGAQAGALEAYRLKSGTSLSPCSEDSLVLYTMYQAIAAAGGTVRNVSSIAKCTITYNAPPSIPAPQATGPVTWH